MSRCFGSSRFTAADGTALTRCPPAAIHRKEWVWASSTASTGRARRECPLHHGRVVGPSRLAIACARCPQPSLLAAASLRGTASHCAPWRLSRRRAGQRNPTPCTKPVAPPGCWLQVLHLVAGGGEAEAPVLKGAGQPGGVQQPGTPEVRERTRGSAGQGASSCRPADSRELQIDEACGLMPGTPPEKLAEA